MFVEEVLLYLLPWQTCRCSTERTEAPRRVVLARLTVAWFSQSCIFGVPSWLLRGVCISDIR